jgi:hypothetical protein
MPAVAVRYINLSLQSILISKISITVINITSGSSIH